MFRNNSKMFHFISILFLQILESIQRDFLRFFFKKELDLKKQTIPSKKSILAQMPYICTYNRIGACADLAKTILIFEI